MKEPPSENKPLRNKNTLIWTESERKARKRASQLGRTRGPWHEQYI